MCEERDADLVVDTANGIGALRPAIDELADGRPVIAVATHGHFDHVGGLAEFDDRRCHEADAAETREPFPVRIERGAHPRASTRCSRTTASTYRSARSTALPLEGFDAAAWVAPGAVPTVVRERRRRDRPRRPRSRCCTCRAHARLHRAVGSATGLLFSGDTAYVDARLGFDDLEAAEASLPRLAIAAGAARLRRPRPQLRGRRAAATAGGLAPGRPRHALVHLGIVAGGGILRAMSERVVLTSDRLLDTAAGEVLRERAVIVEGDRIASVVEADAPTARASISPGTRSCPASWTCTPT